MLRKLSRRLTFARRHVHHRRAWRPGDGSPMRPTSVQHRHRGRPGQSVDIGNNEIGSSDVKDNSLNTFDVHAFSGWTCVDVADRRRRRRRQLGHRHPRRCADRRRHRALLFGGDFRPVSNQESPPVDSVASADVELGTLRGPTWQLTRLPAPTSMRPARPTQGVFHGGAIRGPAVRRHRTSGCTRTTR